MHWICSLTVKLSKVGNTWTQESVPFITLQCDCYGRGCLPLSFTTRAKGKGFSNSTTPQHNNQAHIKTGHESSSGRVITQSLTSVRPSQACWLSHSDPESQLPPSHLTFDPRGCHSRLFYFHAFHIFRSPVYCSTISAYYSVIINLILSTFTG